MGMQDRAARENACWRDPRRRIVSRAQAAPLGRLIALKGEAPATGLRGWGAPLQRKLRRLRGCDFRQGAPRRAHAGSDSRNKINQLGQLGASVPAPAVGSFGCITRIMAAPALIQSPVRA